MITNLKVDLVQKRAIEPVYEVSDTPGRPVEYQDVGRTPFRIEASLSFNYSGGDKVAEKVRKLLGELYSLQEEELSGHVKEVPPPEPAPDVKAVSLEGKKHVSSTTRSA